MKNYKIPIFHSITSNLKKNALWWKFFDALRTRFSFFEFPTGHSSTYTISYHLENM